MAHLWDIWALTYHTRENVGDNFIFFSRKKNENKKSKFQYHFSQHTVYCEIKQSRKKRRENDIEERMKKLGNRKVCSSWASREKLKGKKLYSLSWNVISLKGHS